MELKTLTLRTLGSNLKVLVKEVKCGETVRSQVYLQDWGGATHAHGGLPNHRAG